jgi:autotransporter-associated beta strand protein
LSPRSTWHPLGRSRSTRAAERSTTNGFDTTVSQAIGGAGALTKEGAGTLTLGGASTYSGGTTVNAGTVEVATAASIPNTGTVTVQSGGTLQFPGAATIPSCRATVT